MPRKKPLLKVPDFGSEDEERLFWGQHESQEYLDWGKARNVTLPNLKPSTRTISIRLPESLLDNLKVLANKRNVHYHALVKMYLAECVRNEMG